MLDLRSARCVELQQSADYTNLLATNGPSATAVALDGVKPQDLLAKPAADPAAAAMMLAALRLRHDDLDGAHGIVQQSPADLRRAARSSLEMLTPGKASTDDAMTTQTLAFWHAIVHRREGDFGNAKYWYGHCRTHELLPALGEQVRGTVAHAPADKRLLRLAFKDYDGAAFVDLVQEVHESPSDERHGIAVALQDVEWRVLFDYCTRNAAG